MLRNGLYIIATPIGNLQDISARAVETLRNADIIACEDSRVSKKLFSLLGISINKKFISYEDHSEEQKAQMIIDLINQGNSVALISDAGSPLISDPGYKLVNLCRKQNIYVTSIPGACAVITALQLSGLPTNRFMFAGFIPNKEKARSDLFEELKNINATLVFYETAPRLLKTLLTAAKIFGEREVAVSRELTKMYEETVCGNFTDVINHFNQNEPRGEFVLTIAYQQEKQASAIDIKEILRKRLAKTSLKTAVKEISAEYKLAKNDVYSLALELKNEQLS
ncbi:MAG: 16S rRNA (cytidine(1402)-2'-O)-methyltransferase [Alphaproteobacteria bacterium]|nr:16S rRNA (cytidine(1402)-2'-O)-methyltransferase [Alphaproteobacteria bacterium]